MRLSNSRDYTLHCKPPLRWYRGTLRGTINQTDERETRRLLLRYPEYDIQAQDHEATGEDFPWGGLSGALVFHAGLALGVVIEHHPRQGAATVQLSAFDKLALYAAADSASGTWSFGNSTLEVYVQATTARDLAGHLASGHVDSIGDDTMVISDAFGTVKTYHRQK